MQDSKLVHLFGLLSPSERKQFTLFLASPYFNKREDVRKLAQSVEKRFIKTSKGGNEETLFPEVYPDEPYHASRFNNLKTALQNLLLKFLSQITYEQDPAAPNRYLLARLNATEDEKYFLSYYKKAVTHLEKSKLPESDLHLELMFLEEAYNAFHDRKPQRDGADHLQHSIHHLGKSFLVRVYKAFIEDLTRKSIMGSGLKLTWKKRVLEHIENPFTEVSVVVRGYHTLYQLLSGEDSNAFETLRDLLKEHAGEISQLETLNLYTGLINYAVRLINDGHLDYLLKIYTLYLEMLDSGVLLDKGKISAWYFKNIMNAALRVGEYTWAESFLEHYKDRIDSDYNNNLLEYSTGLLRFYTRNYESAEGCFYRVLDGYKDVFYGINARAYLLQIYYETGNPLGLESLAHSFRMFLDRSTAISEARRRQNVAFILHLKRLANIPLRDLNRLEKLEQDITSKAEKGMGSAWLLEKIGELKAKIKR